MLPCRAAKHGQKKAKERVLAAQQEYSMGGLFGQVAADAEIAKRHLSHLELKNSVAANRQKLALNSEMLRQRQKQKKELEEAEYQQLVEAGLNPYEVYRRRDQAAEVRGGRPLASYSSPCTMQMSRLIDRLCCLS